MANESTTLLSADDVRRWLAERERITAQIDELSRRRAQIDDRLDLVERLIGSERIQNSGIAEFAPDKGQPEPSWADITLGVLEHAAQGLTPSEIATVLKDSPHRNKVIHNPNGLYNALAKLVGRRRAVKREGLYYSTRRYIDLFGLHSSPEQSGARPTTSDEILRIMKDCPEGLRGADIIKRLRLRAADDGGARKPYHDNAVYVALGKLVNRKKLRREGHLYRMAA